MTTVSATLVRQFAPVRGVRAVALGAIVAALTAACTGVGAPASVQAPPDSAAGEMRFHYAGPGGAAIVVPVVVDGRAPIDLILDTGATLTCIDDSLARALNLPERIGMVGAGVGVGGGGRVRLVRVDSLRVGKAIAKDLTACTLDLGTLRRVSPDVHGLLGLNFLKSFRVTLDFRRNVLRLENPNAARSPDTAAAKGAHRT